MEQTTPLRRKIKEIRDEMEMNGEYHNWFEAYAVLKLATEEAETDEIPIHVGLKQLWHDIKEGIEPEDTPKTIDIMSKKALECAFDWIAISSMCKQINEQLKGEEDE